MFPYIQQNALFGILKIRLFQENALNCFQNLWYNENASIF